MILNSEFVYPSIAMMPESSWLSGCFIKEATNMILIRLQRDGRVVNGPWATLSSKTEVAQ